jgi:iron complex transport system permease protein
MAAELGRIAPTAEIGRIAPTRAGRALALVGVLLLALAALVLIGFLFGTRFQLSDLSTVLAGGGTRSARVILMQIRAPRIVLGVAAGAMLALAGALMQDSLRNPLAGPELLGVSAGASLAITIVTIFHITIPLAAYPWLALGGGVASGMIVILSLRKLGDPIRLVLMGVALGSLLYAAIISIVVFGNQADVGLLYLFLLGSLANRTWDYANILLPWAGIGIPLALLMARPLNLLQLGDDMAEGLGLPVLRARLGIMILAAGMVAAVVAVAGPISYVALAAPHLARRILRTPDTRLVLPTAALIGSVLLVAADLIAKNLFDPLELPLGIWTTLLGGPLLLVLLRRRLAGERSY